MVASFTSLPVELVSRIVDMAAPGLPAFLLLRPPVLTRFSVTIREPITKFPIDEASLPSAGVPLPPISITVSFTSPRKLPPPLALLSACAARGIHIIVNRTPDSAASLARAARRPIGSSEPAASNTIARQLEETLQWARRRARWLVEVGDGVGLHELAQATVRLRERHLIDLA
ncbi:hypothetical protein JCM3770_006632 [Rhodotorula araucariae]